MKIRLEVVPEDEREKKLMDQLIDFEPYYEALSERVKEAFAFQLGRVIVYSRDNMHDVPEVIVDYFHITEVGG